MITVAITLQLNLAFSLLNPLEANSSTSITPMVTEVSIDQYDKICGNSSTTLGNTLPTEQQVTYCQSAKSSINAAHSNDMLWKVWAAVAGVCVAACALSVTGVANQFVCMGLNIAGGAADAVITKNFATTLMTALGGSAAGYFINSSINRKAPVTEKDSTGVEKPTNRDIGACVIAATCGFQIYTQYNMMKTNETSARKNLASALNIENTTAAALQLALLNQTPGVPAPSPTAPNYHTAVGAATLLAPPPSTPTDAICSAASSTGNPSAILNCAAASSSNLPPNVTSPKFANDFKKASGLDLGSFLSGNHSPTQALVAAGSGMLTSDQAIQFATAAYTMEQRMNLPNSTYSSGGAGTKNGNTDPSFDAISGMMGQILHPTQGETDPAIHLANIVFNSQNRLPSNVTDDVKISLFNRVSIRYFLLLNSKIIGEGI